MVDRLSPAYFYHLARARYWVNNQNFPHYFTRRADGVYLQTWHGTPLKRMLHDLDVVHGRDAGYLDRVTAASQPVERADLAEPVRHPGDAQCLPLHR